MHHGEWQVCSLIIQAVPEKVSQVMADLLVIKETEIPVYDEVSGKLVVVMQAARSDELLKNIELTRNIDGVLATSLVYHQQDSDADETYVNDKESV